jgi:hypothetical protein
MYEDIKSSCVAVHIVSQTPLWANGLAVRSFRDARPFNETVQAPQIDAWVGRRCDMVNQTVRFRDLFGRTVPARGCTPRGARDSDGPGRPPRSVSWPASWHGPPPALERSSPRALSGGDGGYGAPARSRNEHWRDEEWGLGFRETLQGAEGSGSNAWAALDIMARGTVSRLMYE